MLNWTSVRMSAKNLTNLDIFTDGQFDLNKIVPKPAGLEYLPSGAEKYPILVFYTEKFTKDAGRCMEENPERTKYFMACFREEELSECINSVHTMVDERFNDGKEWLSCSNIHELYELGQKYEETRKRTGAYTWMDWCRHNWGTQWNTSGTKIINEDTIEFLSAWCIPFPALEKLSKKYPDVRFLLDWSNDEEPMNDLRP